MENIGTGRFLFTSSVFKIEELGRCIVFEIHDDDLPAAQAAVMNHHMIRVILKLKKQKTKKGGHIKHSVYTLYYYLCHDLILMHIIIGK